MEGFPRLPPEIRVEIVRRLVDHWRVGDSTDEIAPYASVCREWQVVVEQYTFRELHLDHRRMADFGRLVVGRRRRLLGLINLHVDLPEYANDPCEERETWEDKMANNALFTHTWQQLFFILHDWADKEVARTGIHLYFSIASKSDLRNSTFELWQRRRWNVKDIGEKRFADSYIDFLGQDEELKRQNLLRPVYAITSFKTCPLIRRAILPAAYSDIIARLPNLRMVDFDIIKERRLVLRRAIFDHLGALMTRWSPSLEKVSISANTLCSWRQLPHDSVSEGDSGERLCEELRHFATQLRDLRISNLVRIRELLRPVWPARVEDREAFLTEPPNLPWYPRLEVLHIAYGAIHYKQDWHKDASDINEHDDTIRFRQSISLAAARLALHMPKLRELVISQRPMMWAGKHSVEYLVTKDAATVTWASTFDFKPWDRTIEAWSEVAKKNAGQTLDVEVKTIQGWKTDGSRPLTPALSV